MIRFAVIVIVIVMFVKAANNAGQNPINCSLIGVASYWITSYVVFRALLLLPFSGYTFGTTLVEFIIMAAAGSMLAGLSVCYLVYRRLQRGKPDQDS